MLMGDTVLFEDEVNPAIDAAFANGLEVTALGGKGELQDDVYKITIGREATMHGMKFGGSMGLTTWAAFAGTQEFAVVDGDFCHDCQRSAAGA